MTFFVLSMGCFVSCVTFSEQTLFYFLCIQIICVILHICSLDLLFPSSFSLSVCIGIRKEFSKLSMAFLNMSKAIESDVHTSTIVSNEHENLITHFAYFLFYLLLLSSL